MSVAPPDDALIVSVAPGEVRVGRIERGHLTDLLIDRGGAELSGEIRRAVVRGLDPGSGGAILDIGGIEAYLDRPGEGTTVGTRLLVQVRKPAIGGKRAKVNRRIEIGGDPMILTPFDPTVEISRQLNRQDREHLKNWAAGKDCGLLLGSLAASLSDSALEAEWQRLRGRWQGAVLDGAPGLALAAPDPLERVVAALDDGLMPILMSGARLAGFGGRIEALPIGQEAFAHFGLDEYVDEALLPSVALPSGGRLHIDQTRLGVTLDVDTSGAKDATRTAIEAMTAAARQIRLRNLSGLILIDPPSRGTNRDIALETLRRALKPDPVGPMVYGLTRAGLIEISRPRLRPSLAELMLAPAAVMPSVAAALLSLLRQAAYGPLPKALELSRAGDAWLAGEGERAWADFVGRVGYAPRRLVRSDVADHYGRLIFPGEE